MAPQFLRIALRGLAANKLRSFLTMLGIIIGVASVIVLVAVGTGSSKQVEDRINQLGTNTLTVLRGGFLGGRGGPANQSRNTQLRLTDVQALQDPVRAPDVATVSPVAAGQASLDYEGTTYQPASLIGTTPTYAGATNYQVASGAFLSDQDVDDHAKVVVLGATVVDELFNGTDPLGAVVKINGNRFTVVGTLKPKGSSGVQNGDDIAMMPVSTMQDIVTGRTAGLNSIVVQARSRSVMDEAQAEVTTVLDQEKGIDGTATSPFSVLNQATLLATSNETNRVLTVLLGAVAAISLLVGGIGIMNIMLVTVTERTREIGIRKAVGARHADILRQFVSEAVLLSVLGGLLGVVAGVIGSRFRIVGVEPVIAPYSVVLAFGVAVVIGLFFGIYPAGRAAALRPIDALRYE